MRLLDVGCGWGTLAVHAATAHGVTVVGVANLEEHWDECVRLTSPGRARIWRLYLAGSALAFERNRISIHQVLAVRPDQRGRSGMPATRQGWLGTTV